MSIRSIPPIPSRSGTGREPAWRCMPCRPGWSCSPICPRPAWSASWPGRWRRSRRLPSPTRAPSANACATSSMTAMPGSSANSRWGSTRSRQAWPTRLARSWPPSISTARPTASPRPGRRSGSAPRSWRPPPASPPGSVGAGARDHHRSGARPSVGTPSTRSSRVGYKGSAGASGHEDATRSQGPKPQHEAEGRSVASLFIDGEWASGTSGATSQVINPFDQALIDEVDVADDVDVARAILAARRAFDAGEWSGTTATERGALLNRVADLLQRDRAEIARTETLNTGQAIREGRSDVDDVSSVFRYYAGLADKDAGRVVATGSATASSRIVYEPVGGWG